MFIGSFPFGGIYFILFIQYFKRVSLLAKLASLPSGPLLNKTYKQLYI